MLWTFFSRRILGLRCPIFHSDSHLKLNATTLEPHDAFVSNFWKFDASDLDRMWKMLKIMSFSVTKRCVKVKPQLIHFFLPAMHLMLFDQHRLCRDESSKLRCHCDFFSLNLFESLKCPIFQSYLKRNATTLEPQFASKPSSTHQLLEI